MILGITKITSPEGLGISPKRITISTSGISRLILKLADEKIKFSEFLTDERKGAIKQIAKKIKRRTLRELTQSEDKPQGTEDVAEAGEIIKNKILNDEDKISNFGFNRNLLSVLEFYIGFKIQFEHSGLDIDSVLDENIGGVAMGKGKNMLGNIKKKGSNFDKDSIGGFFS